MNKKVKNQYRELCWEPLFMASSYVQVGYRFYQSAWKIDVKENPPSLGNCPNKAVHPYPPGQRVTILNVQPSEIPVDWTDWRDSSLFFRRQTSWKQTSPLQDMCRCHWALYLRWWIHWYHCWEGSRWSHWYLNCSGSSGDAWCLPTFQQRMDMNGSWYINHRSMTRFGTHTQLQCVFMWALHPGIHKQ